MDSLNRKFCLKFCLQRDLSLERKNLFYLQLHPIDALVKAHNCNYLNNSVFDDRFCEINTRMK